MAGQKSKATEGPQESDNDNGIHKERQSQGGPEKVEVPAGMEGCLEEAAEEQSGGQGERQRGQDLRTRQQGQYGCPHDLSPPE